MFAATATDAYKVSHKGFMSDTTTQLYSNGTARSSKHLNVPENLNDNKYVFFGLQYFIIDYLIEEWNSTFFKVEEHLAVRQLKRRFDTFFGPNQVSIEHFVELHRLGHLPLVIYALPEGSVVNIGVPAYTISNTHPNFAWLVNYVESVMSCDIWKPIHTATIARIYRKLCDEYAIKTTGSNAGVEFQCHDFSFRGMSGRVDAAVNGMAHLLSFCGTDTLPAVDFAEVYYFADAEGELIGTSVPASEHSVTCLGAALTSEEDFFRKAITEQYPTGIVSLVSDSYDYWNVLTVIARNLKDEIMARQPNALGLNKVVFRPDSGDPVKIICGDGDAPFGTPEHKGSIETLWEIFGGTVTEQGYKLLDPHVGLIYGDSITVERAQEIFKQLEAKGFASTNVVFGVGSYSYQYCSRDSLGFAIKATWAQDDGKHVEIFKDPKTDSGVKKSARGLLKVVKEGNDYKLLQSQTTEQLNTEENLLTGVFYNGGFIPRTFNEVREKLKSEG